MIPTPGMELMALTKAVRRRLYKKNAVPHDDGAMLDDFYFVPSSSSSSGRSTGETKTNVSAVSLFCSPLDSFFLVQ